MADFDPNAVRARREKLLLRLLFRATETMNATMADRIRERGFPEFQPSFTGTLVQIDTEGTRIGRIAERLHVTRQAASQMIREIERRGFIERIADPSDARAVIVRHTAKGRRILQTAIEVMLGIEDEYESVLGAEGLADLVTLLGKLVTATDPGGALTER
jgi:DNA-binding MarR family transcriptional regulator